MDSGILNVEEIVMGRGAPDPPAEEPPSKPEKPYPAITTKPPPPTVIQPYQHENLQCFQCFITFCNSKAKERHMKKSHREEYKQQLQQGDTLFTCYVCDRTFSSSEELTEHQPTHSKEDKPFKCPYCHECFRTFSELTAHRRQICPERQFVCKDCNETFRNPAQLRAHRLAQHPRPEAEEGADADDSTKTHRCGKCARGFENEAELVLHQENHAGDQQCNGSDASKKRARALKPEDAAGVEKKGKWKKKKEDEEVKEEVESSNHTEDAGAAVAEPKAKPGRGRPPKAAAGKEATTAGDGKTSAQEKKPKAAPSRQQRCPECDLTFPGLVQLRAHKKEKHAASKETGKQPATAGDGQGPAEEEEEEKKKPKADASRLHRCPECELTFPALAELRAHKKEKHTPRKAHPCEECEESFARPEQLEAHKARVHTTGRYSCPTCGKSFGRESNMKAHQKSHPEEEEEKKKPAGRSKR
ncbi:zinc finger protein 576.2 [Osmerus mordax]|uniref:zinc finger protein 576.2 n=1 Tax=Osmerus mordax TaxID=8014 RepID=UPI00350F73C6